MLNGTILCVTFGSPLNTQVSVFLGHKRNRNPRCLLVHAQVQPISLLRTVTAWPSPWLRGEAPQSTLTPLDNEPLENIDYVGNI